MNTEERMAKAIFDNIGLHKAAKACADICKEQEKNTAVAFADFIIKKRAVFTRGTWLIGSQHLETGLPFVGTTEQLFTIFTVKNPTRK